MSTSSQAVFKKSSLAIAVALACTAASTFAQQDAKTQAKTPIQTVDAGGVSFEVPSTWKSSKPASPMRKAQIKISPAEGDTDPAELIVFAFPGGGGGVDAH